jgi:hypothetical protein
MGLGLDWKLESNCPTQAKTGLEWPPVVFLIIDRRNVGKQDLAADVRRQLETAY